MKRTRKINIVIFMMLCIFTAICVGCNSNNNNSNNTMETTTNNIISDSDDEDIPEFVERIPTGLPEADYSGYEFRILSRGPNYNVHWFARDIYAESETGEPINDAVYTRNKAIEELYNIKIVNFPDDGDLTARASRVVRAGDDSFDMISHGLTQMAAMMTNGSLYDLHTFPHIDLSKPWWDQKAKEQLTINGKLYAMTGDYIVLDKDATTVALFNKQVLNEYSLENPYQLVKDGKWTMDKMYEMMTVVAKDLNGDGAMDEFDQWGLVSQYGCGMQLFNGAGESIAKINSSSGLPEITMYSQRAINVCDKILNIQGDKSVTIHADDYFSKYPNDTVWDEMQLVVFNTNRALFYFSGMNRVTLLRSMETDFGILPPPKFDEAQPEYHSSLNPWCTSSVLIPITVADTERTGMI